MIERRTAIYKALKSSSAFYIFEGDTEGIYSDLKASLINIYKINDFENNVDIRNYLGDEMDVEITKKLVFEIGLKPYANKKIIIINNFQKLKEICQNILLKCLEELPEDTLVFGISLDTVGVLDTIKSRAYNLYLGQSETLKIDERTLIEMGSKEIIQMFTKKFNDDDIIAILNSTFLKSENLLKNQELLESIGTNLRVHEFANECYRRISSNCSKALSYDLLLFRILEEK